MGVEDLRKLLEEADDKFNILADKNILSKYNIYNFELVDLIDEFLSDEQIVKLLEFEHFLKLSSYIRKDIIKNISNSNIKLKLLEEPDLVFGFIEYDFIEIIVSLDNNTKMQKLYDIDFFQRYNIKGYGILSIIKSLSDEDKKELLSDENFIKEPAYSKANIIDSIENEETKIEMCDSYGLKNYEIADILKKCSAENRTRILLEYKYDFDDYMLVEIFDVDLLVNFFREHKDFFVNNNIKPYELTMKLTKEEQLDFISKIEDTGLSLDEKRQILATLKRETKDDIDTSNFPQEYVTAIKMNINNDIINIGDKTYGKIIINTNKDLEIYYGLDELLCIDIDKRKISNEDKEELLKLCENCPEMNIFYKLKFGGVSIRMGCTGTEYMHSEAWIESVLQGIDPKWTDIQKIAYIDNAIGKKIHYYPEYSTEVSEDEKMQSQWKIICEETGICWGISQIEQYFFSKIQIDSEIVLSHCHAFLKLKNIELPNSEGGTVKGNTILDPTWNLVAHRYGGQPENFCRSYKEIRKHDIIKNTDEDSECHKNDEKAADATLDLDEQSLREIFASIGLTDKYGNFPIEALKDKSKLIDNYNLPAEKSIIKQLQLLAEYYPEFATCPNETSSVLSDIILNQENLKFNRCVVNRVYARDDKDKKAVLYVYADLPEAGKKFYFADKNEKQFIEIPQKEFEARFESYEWDMIEGNRIWEVEGMENVEDLSRSSGKIIAREEGGR